MTFGEKLKKLRIEENYTQEALGHKLNVTRQAVTKWENNRGLPDKGTILDISKLFNVTIDSLMNDEIEITKIIEIQEINIEDNNNILLNKKKKIKKKNIISISIISFLILIILSIYIAITSNPNYMYESRGFYFSFNTYKNIEIETLLYTNYNYPYYVELSNGEIHNNVYEINEEFNFTYNEAEVKNYYLYTVYFHKKTKTYFSQLTKQNFEKFEYKLESKKNIIINVRLEKVATSLKVNTFLNMTTEPLVNVYTNPKTIEEINVIPCLFYTVEFYHNEILIKRNIYTDTTIIYNVTFDNYGVGRPNYIKIILEK